MNYLYFAILAFTLFVPLLRSFEPQINFVAKWKYLFPAILAVAIPFIIWDVVFTHKQIWGFNSNYISGIKFFRLPIEEILYFIIIPYSCVFIYEVVNYFSKKDFQALVKPVSLVLIFSLLPIGVFNIHKLYTSYTFVILSLVIIYLTFIVKFKQLGKFYFSFLIILVPFYLVNGVLTGSFITDEVVWYDNTMNLGIRVFTIPVEDHFYGMLQIISTVYLYELFKKYNY